MAIIVEDGTGLSGAQSFASLASVNAYHAARGNTSWTGTDDAKEKAIVRATDYLEARFGSRFKGSRKTRDQALSWPREDATDRDGFEIANDSVPKELVAATAEYALRGLSSALLPDPELGEGAVTQRTESVGPVSESVTYAAATVDRLPQYPEADRKLLPLLRAGGNKVVR